MGLSSGTGKLCIFGHLGLVLIWSCFVSLLFLLLYYVICARAPVPTEETKIILNCNYMYVAVILQMKDSCSTMFKAHNIINEIKQNY